MNPSEIELLHDAYLRFLEDIGGRIEHDASAERVIRAGAEPEIWQMALLDALPGEHRRFFERLELMVALGDYLFVHAGVRPGVPLDAQHPRDLIWIRGEFLRSQENFGKVVVHGHTPTPVVEMRGNRIGIDTGAVFTNRLTALRLQDGSRRLLQTEE
mgnify:CR=1 FL=1